DLDLTVVDSLYGAHPGDLLGRFPRTGRLFSGTYELVPPCFEPGFVIGVGFRRLSGLGATHVLDDAMVFYLDQDERVVFEQSRRSASSLSAKCLTPLPPSFDLSLAELRTELAACASPQSSNSPPIAPRSELGSVCWSCQ
ncbi:MAG: hypothetical protein AAFQ82_09360, partial [Myxococcota bacterium]